MNPNRFTDSAGTPWEGRKFSENLFQDDDGSAPSEFIEAIELFRSGAVSVEKVVEVIRSMRFLIPLIANLGESTMGDHGLRVDKSAELAIVTVKSPDKQDALVAFSSVDAMKRWNPSARPVPSDAVRLTLAAASQQATRVAIDPGSETEFVIRRPLIAKLAQQLPWQPVELDPWVHELVKDSLSDQAHVTGFELASADPSFRLLGPELEVRIAIQSGLEPEVVREFLELVTRRWGDSEVFAELVDSVSIKLVAS